MDNRGIGVLDSGVGGLTALKEIRKLIPEENVIYFGDTLNSPYGEKSAGKIISCVDSGIKFLKSKNVKIILLACGTASCYIEKIDCGIPIIGIITPSCKKAVELSKNKKIGVLATSATVNCEAYKKNILNLDPTCTVYEQACPKLASIIENGNISTGDTILKSAISEYLSSINDSNIDTLILGCTHYPIVADSIKNLLKNQNIKFVIPGQEIAPSLKKILQEKNIFADKRHIGRVSYFVSGKKETFCKTAEVFLEYNIKNSVLRV